MESPTPTPARSFESEERNDAHTPFGNSPDKKYHFEATVVKATHALRKDSVVPTDFRERSALRAAVLRKGCATLVPLPLHGTTSSCDVAFGTSIASGTVQDMGVTGSASNKDICVGDVAPAASRAKHRGVLATFFSEKELRVY